MVLRQWYLVANLYWESIRFISISMIPEKDSSREARVEIHLSLNKIIRCNFTWLIYFSFISWGWASPGEGLKILLTYYHFKNIYYICDILLFQRHRKNVAQSFYTKYVFSLRLQNSYGNTKKKIHSFWLKWTMDSYN